MENLEYSYWQVDFISCEGNNRWTIVRAPLDVNEYDVRTNIETGGCGDDISEIVDVYETYQPDEEYFYTDICYKFE